ncbi:hypothetical protein [Clostridium haemolyticum]|nr:hypothetical protein [Clostridium haemolyticum]
MKQTIEGGLKEESYTFNCSSSTPSGKAMRSDLPGANGGLDFTVSLSLK